jgi:ribose transport system substrate-binding protein
VKQNIHALIIDDNRTDQMILSRLLSLEGVQVSQIFNPAELEANLQVLDDVDIVFVDLEMPNLNGYEVFQILKQYLGDAVPLVACTVHTSEVNTVRDLGFNSFLGKPLKSNLFSAQFHAIMEGKPVWEFK